MAKDQGTQLRDGATKEKNASLKTHYMVQDMLSSTHKEETSFTVGEECQPLNSLSSATEMTSTETTKSQRAGHLSHLEDMTFQTATDSFVTGHLSSLDDMTSTTAAEGTQRTSPHRPSSVNGLSDDNSQTPKPNTLRESIESSTPKNFKEPTSVRLVVSEKQTNYSDDYVGNEPIIQKNGVAAITPGERGPPTLTIKDQSVIEGNFVGDAFYYNLLRGANRRELAGDYVIVYTRPFGGDFDPKNDKRSKIFAPSFSRRITLATMAPHNDDTVENRFLRRRLQFGGFGTDLGVGECTVETIGSFLLFCDLADEDPRNKHSHKTTFRVQKPRILDSAVFEQAFIRDEDCLYLKGFLENASITGSTIGFGVQQTKTENGVKYGFNFAEIELAFRHPTTTLPDRQIFVAVKIPKTDISSVKVLTQRITSRHDLQIIEDRGSDMASYFYYCDSFQGSGWSSAWGKVTEKDIGISRSAGQFNPTFFERYLFLQDDRLEELKSLVRWLKSLVATSMETEGLEINDLHKEAHKYATCRLKGMQKEAYVCQPYAEDSEEDVAMEAEANIMEVDSGIMAVEDLNLEQDSMLKCKAKGEDEPEVEHENFTRDPSSELSDLEMQDVGGVKL